MADSAEVLQRAVEAPNFPSGPMVWGPLQWQTLVQLLRGYPLRDPPAETQQALRDYVKALVRLLPCSICAKHWAQLADSVQTGSRYEALKWLIDTHNAVNKRLHKPELTYQQALDAMMAASKGNVFTPACKACVAGECKSGRQCERVFVPVAVVLFGVFSIVIVVLAVLLAAAKRRK